MRAQRACRRFDPDGKVLDSDIEQMLQTAVHAPSAENTQPWSFVVVRDEESRKLLSSIYPAVQNLLLAAADLGYGSCLTTGLTTFGVDRVRERLGLPDPLSPMAAVYLGPPAKKLSAPRRRPATEVTYREKFGAAW
jgi:nitroreductase